MRIVCAHCRKKCERLSAEVARARRAGLKVYCDRKCSGRGRRKHLTKAFLVRRKAAYDTEYRTKNRALLKAKKHAYFKSTYDPAKAAVERKARMPKRSLPKRCPDLSPLSH